MSKFVLVTILLSVFVLYCIAESEQNCNIQDGSCPCGSGKQSKVAYYTGMNNPVARRKRALVARKAKEGDWPWAVAVAGGRRCTGTLIHERWVLTAAHCVDDAPLVEYGGEKIGKLERAKVKGSIIHEGFEKVSDTFIKNDIALIELEEPIKKSGNVYEICIPTTVEPKDGEIAVFAGFGKMFYKLRDFERTLVTKTPIKESEIVNTEPDYLRETPVPLLTKCAFDETTSNDEDLKNIVCTGQSGHGTSEGDAGGPLMVLRDGKWALYGISSTYWNTAVPEDLLAMMANDIYTKVGNYCTWINEKTNGEVKCQ